MTLKTNRTAEQENNLLLQRLDEATARLKIEHGIAAILIGRVVVGPTFNQDHPNFEQIQPGQRFNISLWQNYDIEEEKDLFKIHLDNGRTGPVVDFTREQIEQGELIWDSEHPDIKWEKRMSKILNFFQ